MGAIFRIPLAAIAGVCVAASAYAQDRVVELSVAVLIQADNRVIVEGTTNLPAGVDFVVSIDDARTKESRGQSKAVVTAEGQFRSELLGPAQGLKDGAYIASVTMPFPFTMNKSVQSLIGPKGEHLKGPLIQIEPLGATINVEKEFVVGGANALVEQADRLQGALKGYEAFKAEQARVFSDLEATYRKHLLRDAENLENLRAWGEFARACRTRLIELDAQLDEIDSQPARFHLGDMLGNVKAMFHAAAFSKDREYASAKTDYLTSVKDLDAYLAQLRASLRPDPDISQVTTQIREWVDNTGKFRIKGSLVSFDGKTVSLRKEDGSQISLPVSRLSEADKKFLKAKR